MSLLPAFPHTDSYQRPSKRQRQSKPAEDGARPYINITPGHATLHADDTAGDGKKNRKRPLSCGECRRLKLKCDRVFPCQSCCKRGCAEICPDGALTGGKGSRFILANTEQLHDKIKVLSERIRELEDALQSLQSQMSTQPHPLLRSDLLLIKKSPELFGVDRLGATNENSTDNTKGENDDDHDHVSSSSPDGGEEIINSTCTTLPDEIAHLSRTFPSPWSASSELSSATRERIRSMLPSIDRAQYLCKQARINALWQYNPDSSETYLPNLIHSVYNTPNSGVLPHRLGLFFMILAIGSLVDIHNDPDRNEAEGYHNLARAALSEAPVMEDTSFDAINALFFMEWYLTNFSDMKKAGDYAWGIMGFMTKLAQSIALHRDPRSKVIPEELEKRRNLYWDIMGIDARLSLMMGRPPSICITFVDARQPEMSNDDSVIPLVGASQFHGWRHAFLIQCVWPIVQLVNTPQTPSYTDVLGLDRRIRDFPVPPTLQMVDNEGVAPQHPLAMQQAMTSCCRELAILQLHRSLFVQALNAPGGFNAKYKYAPSVLAVFRSASNLIWTLQTLYRWEPELSTRYLVLWSNCFSAAIALCLLVSRAPSCSLAPNSLQELAKVIQLFDNAKDQCPKCAQYLPVLESLIGRCRTSYVSWLSGCENLCPKDDVCSIAQRAGLIHLHRDDSPAASAAAQAVSEGRGNPFENAHPTLLRVLEKLTVQAPCSEDMLINFGGPVSTLVDMPPEEYEMDRMEGAFSLGGIGSEIQDSRWMTWF